MRILILYTYNKGLLSNFFQELSSKLNKDGLEVHNYYLKHRKEAFVQDGVQIYGDKRGGYFFNYVNIFKIILRVKPDIVISNFSYVNPALLFGKLLRVKSNIVWFHTVYGHNKPNKLKIWIKKQFLKLADKIITNSLILQGEVHTIYKVQKHKIFSIPFWTNIQNYSKSTISATLINNKSVFTIGCPGRLLADKNHEIVIRAVHKLKAKGHTVKLFIAGWGDYKKKLEQIVKELNLHVEVEFLGLLNVHEMVVFYKKMDVLVLPSLNEAFGLVFIEAIALGSPVIVSSKFGSLSFIDQKKYNIVDFTFNPDSEEELILKLLEYINKRGLNSIFFKQLYAETFDKEKIYKSIKDIIIGND
ncbi:glycosyltransferase family 4 protein [Ichthyenterobacterium sp. W332]|uniref:Glycosyltransferase family 4 protein n=1 Tax=Microcosmobacter mediterraneus TaxID=3075607 RepID=A0ABU2YGQ8_9FLAO|nr:glycosyltransferase family 4 protein [Ichthyenterobacterium sp. W332]MDT0557361.1 glycosyltransferase family 4 protein [Ichthyenterobacterium sp. W332]